MPRSPRLAHKAPVIPASVGSILFSVNKQTCVQSGARVTRTLYHTILSPKFSSLTTLSGKNPSKTIDYGMLALKRMTEIYLSFLLYIDHFMHYSGALIILRAEEVHTETWENSGRRLQQK